MDDTQFRRRLSAVLSADAQGYSRLMGADDVSTVHRIKTCRDIMTRLIENKNGRVVDAPGDNLLAEFGSVVDAVDCALKVQIELAEYNNGIREEEQMHFRIGVNLGDLVIDEGRIYGDGVNIAARLEKLAEPGGVCISGAAYEQVQGKLALGCEYLGEQAVKNIQRPVPAYRVWLEEGAAACGIPVGRKAKRGMPWKYLVPIAAATIIVAAASALYMGQPTTKSTPKPPPAEIAPGEGEKASIAVLPFVNLGENKTQEYLCDGITRDLITDLSKFHDLAVTASYMSFRYKGKIENLESIAHELGARYVLEGSMQTSGDRIRVNAQLIEVPSGKTLWADRYDRKTREMFDVQEDIIQTIVRVLSLKISEAELDRIRQKDTASYEAYDYVQQGWYEARKRKRDNNRKAAQLYQKAVAIDPNYADAYVGLAEVRMAAANYGWTEFPGKSIQQALGFAKKAVDIDPNNAQARSQLGYIYMRSGEYDLAVKELETAIDLNPNNWRSYRDMGAVLLYSGRPEEALGWYKEAMKYDTAITAGLFMNMGIMHLLTGQYESAVHWLEEGTVRWPDFLGTHIVLAAAYAEMNRLHDARSEVDEIKRISPLFQTEFYGSAYRNPEHRARIVKGLRKAGLR
ncbi:Adenylate cyclase (EC [Olavius algarvensis associated proteobacterium Delta 3]|nr:Adenylate cyclase (EC [Olavius algarvensis associated proteobacterium Delta 3]